MSGGDYGQIVKDLICCCQDLADTETGVRVLQECLSGPFLWQPLTL